MSSSVVNYLFALWSTNFNVQSNTFRRLPIPTPDTFPHERLVEAVDAALDARARIESKIRGTRGSYDSDSLALDLPALLRGSGVPTTTLRSAELSGRITRAHVGPTRRVGWLFERDHIASPDDEYVATLAELMQREAGARWEEIAPTFLVPEATSNGTWRALLTRLQNEANQAVRDFASAISDLDCIVVDWYGLPVDLHATVADGPPWGYKAARERFQRLVGRTA
jgi:hypothetical protein